MMQILTLADVHQWRAVLQRIAHYDFCHTPDYHQIAEDQQEGLARCIVYEDDHCCICLPLLLREFSNIPQLADESSRDITSAYGYVGPIHAGTLTETSIQAFQKGLLEWLDASQVVALFSRLHPLMPAVKELQGLGNIITLSQTVSIDLSQPLEVQRAKYHNSNKNQINKLRRAYTVKLAETPEEVDTYISIYHENMDRVHAKGYYYFSREYFHRLMACEDFKCFIILAMDGDQAMAGSMFICTGQIIQYHLAGTRTAYLKQTPMKLILDEARVWGTSQGYKNLHLGGGVGSVADSLFLFKTSFSDLRHDFKIWKWIVNQEKYDDLVAKVGLSGSDSSFFPLYRSSI